MEATGTNCTLFGEGFQLVYETWDMQAGKTAYWQSLKALQTSVSQLHGEEWFLFGTGHANIIGPH